MRDAGYSPFAHRLSTKNAKKTIDKSIRGAIVKMPPAPQVPGQVVSTRQSNSFDPWIELRSPPLANAGNTVGAGWAFYFLMAEVE